MKNITFSEFIDKLDEASAVSMDGSEVTWYQTDEEDGKPVVLIETSQSGMEIFSEESNPEVKVREDGIAVLVNQRGEKTTIQRLVHADF